MCTLVFALRPAPGIVLAATGNRNEFLARPARAAQVEPGPDPVLLPRDLRSGGTWLGLNARGMFACLTNRRGAVLDPGRASRGELVLEALRSATASAAKERIGKVPGNRHNGFHLLFADANEAWIAVCDGVRLEFRPVLSGLLLVVTERSYGAGEGVREAEVKRECAPLFSDPGLSAATLRPPMQRHGEVPLEGACVHADDLGYGTRSSLQLVVRESRAVELLWTEGHPCTDSPSDLSAQATALLRT
ncbi:MAG: NRDE family protein [Deltaproteobacteria bacterium]|nr:MAG: NRDE family protein [Deltaproteobacteria bacterium]TMB37077.1 MAG: NRDE family protein [Deltaproteobacteria bacterium]